MSNPLAYKAHGVESIYRYIVVVEDETSSKEGFTAPVSRLSSAQSNFSRIPGVYRSNRSLWIIGTALQRVHYRL